MSGWQEGSHRKPRTDLSLETNAASTLTSNSQPLDVRENKFLLSKPFSPRAILWTSMVFYSYRWLMDTSNSFWKQNVVPEAFFFFFQPKDSVLMLALVLKGTDRNKYFYFLHSVM